jgi:hypothetical protein
MVRRPHRRSYRQTATGQLYARGRVDAAHLERLVMGEGWEEAAESRGKHRLARTRRADEEDVVATRGGDLQCPARHDLPSHISEVRSAANLPRTLSQRFHPGPTAGAAQGGNEFDETPRPTDVAATRQSCFRGAPICDHDTFVAGCPDRGDERDHAGDRPERSVKS